MYSMLLVLISCAVFQMVIRSAIVYTSQKNYAFLFQASSIELAKVEGLKPPLVINASDILLGGESK